MRGLPDDRQAQTYALWNRFGFRPYATAPDTCSSEKIRALERYWHGKVTAGRLPGRDDLDPADIVPLLPFVLLMDIAIDPLSIRYRLVGTAIAEASRRDFTGLGLDQMQFDAPGERETFEAGYRLMIEKRAPIYGRMVWLASSDLPVVYQSAVFPLASDGQTIDKAIAIEDHDRPINELAERLPPRPLRRGG